MITHTRALVMPNWAGNPVEEIQWGWPVITRFESAETRSQMGLTDLTHRPKALVQGPAVERLGVLTPGKALWTGQAFVGCLKPDEAVLFDLTGSMEPRWPDPHYTDMTEAWVLLALFGPHAKEVIQRLVEIDVERPDLDGPFYLVTKSHAITLHIVNPKGPELGFILACDRSHGQNLFDSCIRAGRQLGLRPVGIEAFQKWFDDLRLKG